MIHYIKTEAKNFKAVADGKKKFEVRHNDRDYKEFDAVYLVEYIKGMITGRELGPFEIKYIFHGGQYGLAEDHCIFNW